MPQDNQLARAFYDPDESQRATCPVCDQVYDLSDTGQAQHHGREPHEPLPSD